MPSWLTERESGDALRLIVDADMLVERVSGFDRVVVRMFGMDHTYGADGVLRLLECERGHGSASLACMDAAKVEYDNKLARLHEYGRGWTDGRSAGLREETR